MPKRPSNKGGSSQDSQSRLQVPLFASALFHISPSVPIDVDNRRCPFSPPPRLFKAGMFPIAMRTLSKVSNVVSLLQFYYQILHSNKNVVIFILFSRVSMIGGNVDCIAVIVNAFLRSVLHDQCSFSCKVSSSFMIARPHLAQVFRIPTRTVIRTSIGATASCACVTIMLAPLAASDIRIDDHFVAPLHFFVTPNKLKGPSTCDSVALMFFICTATLLTMNCVTHFSRDGAGPSPQSGCVTSTPTPVNKVHGPWSKINRTYPLSFGNQRAGNVKYNAQLSCCCCSAWNVVT